MKTKIHFYNFVHTHGTFVAAVLCGVCLALFCLWIPDVLTNSQSRLAGRLILRSTEAPAITIWDAPMSPLIINEPQKAPETIIIVHSSESSSSQISAPTPSTEDTPTIPTIPTIPTLPTVPPTPVTHPAAPSIQQSSSSSSASVPTPLPPLEPATVDAFPAFGRTVQPVRRVPNWGAMSGIAEWRRPYSELSEEEFVPVPAYNLTTLTIPMQSLRHDDFVNTVDIPLVTAKLYYSTRYMGAYDLDADEGSGNHPGVDLKLALGTPLGAIAGGRVYAVSYNDTLGLHLIVEHRNDSGQFFSVYGHLDSARVGSGDTVSPGEIIGTVGLTGMTTAPHLHLEVHRGSPMTADGLTPVTFDESTVINPMTFIAGNGRM